MNCTNTDCGRQTSIYLCTKCIVELDDLLSQVPLLIVALDPGLLANKVTKAPGANGETRNTNKAGSQAPMNVDVDQLRDWLKTMWNHRAYDIATNYPDAGHWLFMARLWVDKANTVTHGPDIPEIDHESNRERIKEVAPPMRTRELIPWLRQHAKVSVTGMQLRQWVARGKLKPVERAPQPTYHPHEVIETWHATRKG